MIIFRVDASKEIGLGHLMRCMALAEGFQKINIETLFMVKESNINVKGLITEKGFRVTIVPISSNFKEEIILLKETISKNHPLAVVLDGYNFGHNYQKLIKNKQFKLVYLGWSGDNQYNVDIIVNPNIWAKTVSYKNAPGKAKLLLGTKYVLLRNEIINESPVIIKNDFSNILVTFGGSIYSEHSYTVYECLRKLPYFFNLVIGSRTAEDNALQSSQSKPSIEFTDPKSIQNMSELKNIYNLSSFMKQADLVISGAGTTCWELCYMGIPFVTYIFVKNQEQNAIFLQQLGISLNMGWWSNFSCNQCKENILYLADNWAKRKDMSQEARKLVDGKGVDRVVKEIVNTGIKDV